MLKRIIPAAYAFMAALMLCGCAYFETEYKVVEDYAPPVQSQSDEQAKISVSNIDSLEQAIRTIISDREKHGKIVFDTGYNGDPTEDMSKACWQVRTQDALCAYCVDNISYEISKIVTYYEAKLSISYSEFVNASEDIVRLPYSAGIESVIKSALESGESKLVILVDHSMYTAEDISGLVLDVYRSNPVSSPAEPFVSVNMFSGTDMQRLYEISFYYNTPVTELERRRKELSEFAPFAELDTEGLSESERALLAFEYIVENCNVNEPGICATAYDALIRGEADSEGIALALVELCRQLELDCRIVYGQHDWREHCWNIIRIDDYYCHIDAGLKDIRDIESCFLKSDEAFWENYRWDMSSYPVCNAAPQEEETETAEEASEAQPELPEEQDVQPDTDATEPENTEPESDEEDQELLVIEMIEEK